MADEKTAEQPNLDPAESQTTEKPPDEGGAASSAAQEDFAGKLAALQAQFERERERNQLLEQSLKIQEKFLQSRQEPEAPKPTDKDPGWTNELDVLDKALDPLLTKRFKGAIDPIIQRNAQLEDSLDAMNFRLFLQQNNPEVLEDEDNFAKTMQQVENVMQVARGRGLAITRSDAYLFANGAESLKAKVQQRKQKRSSAATTETRRQAEVTAAKATESNGAPRVNANAQVNQIRAKAAAGERLTKDERDKLRDFIGDVNF